MLASIPEPATLPEPQGALYCPPPEPSVASAMTTAESRDALARAALGHAERSPSNPADVAVALLHLDVLEEAHPILADWVNLQRGDLLLGAERWAEAESAYEAALESIDGANQLRARLGRVRALLGAGHRDAEAELTRLKRRYADLPQAAELELEHGRMHERAENPSKAARIYKMLDLRFPGTGAAAEARASIARLTEAGVTVRPLSEIQRVERTEKLVRWGPLDAARGEVAALLEDLPRSVTHRARVFFMAAKMARHEGRFAEAEALLGRGRSLDAAVGDAEDQERRADRAADMGRAAKAREREDALRSWSRYKGRNRLTRINSGRLVLMLKRVASAGLAEETNAALAVLEGRTLPPRTRLDIALHAAGVGEPQHLLGLLEGVDELRGERGTMARYYQGRALMELGRHAEAEAAFLDVMRREQEDPTPYYGMWGELMLAQVRGAMIGACGVNATCNLRPGYVADRAARLGEGRLPAEAIRPTPARPTPDLDALAARLAPITADHGEALPWLARAEAFLRLGKVPEARQQLYEAFLAWRHAKGRPIRRCGLESVARGAKRPRRFVDWQLKRDRRALDASDLETLVSVSYAIGETGAATGFGGWSEVQARPRAHAALVEEAARNHGLDPNLLFAVMRVESVYQTEIVSYAGAIGLAQIMPRTGTLIAMERGMDDFTPADLLKPEVNLDFAAWYLRSLIDRWDGHLPLAIASYNGGPHNVRRWLAERSEQMPLDTFLEHIPFTQTHRYVRRVLTHYQAYRAQQGLAMVALSTELPEVGVDPVGF